MKIDVEADPWKKKHEDAQEYWATWMEKETAHQQKEVEEKVKKEVEKRISENLKKKQVVAKDKGAQWSPPAATTTIAEVQTEGGIEALEEAMEKKRKEKQQAKDSA